MLQRVVAVVVAEGAFGLADMGRNDALNGEFGFGDQRQATMGVFHPAQTLALQERGQNQLGQVFGQGGDGREHQRGRAADEDDQRKGLVALLGNVVVKAAPFLDLPVHAQGLRVVSLDAVHAEVVVAGVGVLGVDQGQGDKVAAVLGPGLEQGQAGEVGRGLHVFADRTPGRGLHADLECSREQILVRPELARRQRGQVLGQLH